MARIYQKDLLWLLTEGDHQNGQRHVSSPRGGGRDNPQTGEQWPLQRVSQGARGLRHIGLPSPGALSPEHLALEATGLTFRSLSGLWEMDSTLKGASPFLQVPGQKQQLAKSLAQISCWSRRVSQRGRRWPQLALGTWTLAQLIRPRGHWCRQVPFRNPPSILLAPDSALPRPESLEASVLGHLEPSN